MARSTEGNLGRLRLHPDYRHAAAGLPGPADRYIGRYRFGPGTLVIVVTGTAKALRLTLPWASGVPLYPEGGTSGFFAADGTHVEFAGPATGAATEVTVTPVGRAPLRGARITDP